MAQEKDQPLLDVEEAFSKTEQYIEENKNNLIIIVTAIVLIVGGYFAWKYLYVAAQETEAQNEIFMAINYLEKDSLDKAINGDGAHKGFKDVAEEYSVTSSGNLAHYYLGISYLKKGEYENAIEALEEFDGDDQIIGPIAMGAIGDAHMELGHIDDAISFYLKAAKKCKNNFTTPIYLKKAALAYEEKKDYAEAIKVYEKIKEDYKNTMEGRDMDKYMARAKELSK